uniref:Caspase-3 n=1 Tax=Neogobius melanostomus TaxID=47308 RepID=A0A8C6TP25_9GOBI
MAEAAQSSGDTVDASTFLKENPCLGSGGDTDDPEKRCETTVQESSKAQTDKDPFRYRTDFPSMGVCLLINNKNFHPETGQAVRTGTDVDAAAVKKTFVNLGYKMMMCQDLTVKEMREKLQSVAQEDHSKRASFVCVILSHGDEGVIFGTDGFEKLDVLTRYFKGDKCKTLVGKPKLFFIQACRGLDFDDGTDIESDAVAEDRIPVEADFLYAYSTSPGNATHCYAPTVFLLGTRKTRPYSASDLQVTSHGGTCTTAHFSSSRCVRFWRKTRTWS